MPKNYKTDLTDLKILEILKQDARKPYAEVAKSVNVSQGTIHVRMNKMENAGIVEKTILKINAAKIGYNLSAFIGIYLEKSILSDIVIAKLKEVPEVINIHITTGPYSLFIKVQCRDTMHLKDVLRDKIQVMEGVRRTDTMVSLEESLDRSLKLAD